MNAPTVGTLARYAGEEGDLVLHRPAQHGSVGLLDLVHAEHAVSAGPGLGGEGDGVPGLQGVDVPEDAMGTSVVTGDADIALPD